MACCLDKIAIRATIRQVRSITSHLVILQRPKLTDWQTDLAVAPELNSRLPITMCAFTMCACAFIVAYFLIFLAHFASYFRSVFPSAFRLSQLANICVLHTPKSNHKHSVSMVTTPPTVNNTMIIAHHLQLFLKMRIVNTKTILAPLESLPPEEHESAWKLSAAPIIN